MLKIWLGSRDTTKVKDSNIDVFFDNNYYEDWFNDPLVKEMVLDVDKTKVLSPYCFQSPVLGQIPPTMLSGGVKALIMMLKWDKVVDATACGENCAKWLVEIGKIKDLEVDLEYIMPINPMGDDVMILNDGSVVNTDLDLIDKELDFLGG